MRHVDSTTRNMQDMGMTKFAFAHRATGLPGADPATDRSVLCDGRSIGRVYQVEPGHLEAGRWSWSCFWIGSDTRGLSDTLEQGLEAIKTRVTPEALGNLPP